MSEKLHFPNIKAFGKNDFLVSRDGLGALPRGVMGLSTVCDCGIF